MSTNIDKRIVQMEMDNTNFERNAKKSISTLDKLKESLNFSNHVGTLKSLNTQMKSMDFNILENGLNSIKNSFGALKTIATGALLKIGEEAEQTAAKLFKSLSIGNITSGWTKYNAQTASVQTILSSVSDKLNELTGEKYNINDIMGLVEKLSWYTDETSYSLEQMTNAIASFTASGQDLNISTKAIIGIANACAFAGVSTEKAEHAFTGLSKAIGSNKLTLSIWNNQLKTAGLSNSERFRLELLDAAASLGQLTKELDKNGNAIYKFAGKVVSTANITEFMAGNDSYFTSDIILKALETYAEGVDGVYEEYTKLADQGVTTSEILAKLTDEFKQNGKEIPIWLKSFENAQEAITFAQAIQSVKDAVSSGWATTFTEIFGNEQEAKDLWTTLANDLYSIFAEGGNKRNAILKQWHDGITEFQKNEKKIFDEEGNEISELTQIINKYDKKLKEIYDADYLENKINKESKKIELFTTLISRNTKEIGKYVLENKEIVSDSSFFTSNETKYLQEHLNYLDELIEKETDANKQLELREKYYEEIGNYIKNNTRYEELYASLDADKILGSDNEKYLSILKEYQSILKSGNMEKANEFYEKNSKILLEQYGITKDLNASNEHYYEIISNLVTEKDEIEKFFKAIEEGDSENLLKLFNSNPKVFLDNIDQIPKKIIETNDKINSLKNEDYFEMFIADIEKLTEEEKKNLKVTGYETEEINKLKEAIKVSDGNNIYSILKEYENTTPNILKSFEGYDQIQTVMKNIGDISKDVNKSEAEKVFEIGEQKELLNEIFQNYSNIDEVASAQEDLNKQLVDYFIEAKSGYEYFVDALKTGFSSVVSIIDTIKQSWETIFPSFTALGLIDLANSFKDFMEELKPTEEELEKIGGIFNNIFSYIKKVLDNIKDFGSYIKSMLSPSIEKVTKNLPNILNKIWTIIQTIGTFIKTIADNFIKPLVERLKPIIEDIVDVFGNLGLTIFNTTENAKNEMSDFIELLDSILSFLDPIINFIGDIVKDLKDFTSTLAGTNGEMDETNEKFSLLGFIFDIIGSAFKKVGEIFTSFEGILDKVGNAISFIWDKIQDFVKGIKDVLINPIGDSGINPLSIFGILFALQEGFDFKFNLVDPILAFLEPIKAVTDVLDSLSAKFSAEALSGYADGFKNIAKTMLIIAASLLIIASINEDDLKRSLGVFTILAGILIAFSKITNSVNQSTGGKGLSGLITKLLGGKGNAFRFLTSSLVQFGLALVAMAASLKIISSINIDQLGVALLGLAGSLVIILGSIALFNKFTKGMRDNKLLTIGKVIRTIGFGLIEIALALKIMGSMEIDQLGVALLGLAGSLVIILGTIALFNKFTKNGGKEILAVAAALTLIAPALLVLAGVIAILGVLPVDVLLKAGGALLAFFAIVSGVSMLLGSFGGIGAIGILALATAMVIMASSVLILSKAIDNLLLTFIAFGTLGPIILEPAKDMMNMMLGTLVKFALVLGILSPFLLLGSAALLAFGASLKLLGEGLKTIIMLSTIMNLLGDDLSYSITKMFSTVFQALLELIPGFIVGLITGAVNAFVGTAETILGAIRRIMDLAIELLGTYLYPIVRLVVEFITICAEALSANAERLATAVINIIETILTVINDHVPDFFVLIENTVVSVLDHLSTLVTAVCVGILNFIITVIEGVATAIDNNSSLIGEALGHLVGSIVMLLPRALRGALTGVRDSVIDGIKSLFTDDEGEAGITANETGKELITSVGSGAEEKQPELANTVETVLTDTADDAKTQEVTNAFESDGNFSVSGIISGIMSDENRQRLFDAGAWMFDQENAGYKWAADQNSPSKEMAKNGKFTILGLIKGIKDNAPKLFDAGAQMAEALNTAVELANDSITEDMNPVITPVLDLSNIKYQSGYISDLLNGSSINANVPSGLFQNGEKINNQTNNINVNVDFQIDNSGKDITDIDVERWSDMLVDSINNKLGMQI